jgi:hypothetical protein
MRHTSHVSLRQLELTNEEIAFLQPQAAAMFAKFAKATSYDPDDEPSFYNFLAQAQVERVLDRDPQKVIGIKVIHGLANPSANDTAGKDRQLETKLDPETGLGLKHSSYGGIRIGNPSGADNMLVGSASLGNNCKSIGLTTGQLSLDIERDPMMSAGGVSLIELIMSVEQFCMFIRGNKGIQTPCGMSRGGQWADDTPVLTHAKTSQRDLMLEIKQAVQPVSIELKAFANLLEKGVSKKSDYVDLITAAEQAHATYQAVTEEISAIVKTAGMKEGQVAKRQFEADMTERMGQLKLGGELNALVRGLGHDSGKNESNDE